MTRDKKRILLAEDDPSVLKVTKFRLEHEGYEVVPVSNGEEVLHQVQSPRVIHLVLLDVKMPKLNGYEVCRALKQRAATAKIPVIIFSGSETQLQQLADRFVEVGATDWVKKPFQTSELMEKIHRALGEKGESR